MTVKGDLKVEIDEQGVEVRVTITPEESGGEITPESIAATLVEMKVRTPVDTEAVDKAFRTLTRRKAEPVTFIAAAGVPPQPAVPETVQFSELPIPDRLVGVSRRVLAAAPPARGYRLREDRVKTEKKVMRKGALPFLPAREEIQVVMEKRTVREDVRIDPTVKETGLVTRGAVVARIQPGRQGKEGKSVFGRLIQAPRPETRAILYLQGLSRAGAEVKADVTGFLRRGDGWCDVVPFQDHAVEVTSSLDKQTCLLTLTPGTPEAPPPDPEEIYARARALGFDSASLLTAAEITALLDDAISHGKRLAGRPLTPSGDASADVAISDDKLKAVLNLRKGRGGGTPLTTSAVSGAIRASKVRGYSTEAIRRDLRAFLDGPETEMTGYVLVQGKPPKPGNDSKLEWVVRFVSAKELEAVRASITSNAEALKAVPSRDDFPPERIEAAARVRADEEVVKVIPAAGGIPGVDVFGAAIAPGSGAGADLKLFEGIQLKRNIVVATKKGVLERGSSGKTVLLRVRPHQDGELAVAVAQDRMRATLTHFPAEGDGKVVTGEIVREKIRQAGVQRGINEDRLKQALERIARGVPLTDYVFAEGRPPHFETTSRINFHVRLATGKALSFRPDGTADFRAQDRITRVRKGELIASLRPRDPRVQDGWDVTGTVLSPPPELIETLQAGTGVRADLQVDGSTRFTSAADGELRRDGSLLTVMDAHFVTGDVDMSSGNVNFPGNVRVGGTVRSGFTVVSAGALEVEGSVEGALLSADGGVTIALGIKGEGRAVLRSKRGIESLFAEQAALLAIGNVHLHGGCVRCQVKCNGKLLLDSEKGNLVGGEVRASRGAEVQNIGTVGGIRTVVSFGQDFLIRDQIDRADRDVAALDTRIRALDGEMKRLEKAAPGAAVRPDSPLGKARTAKREAMKLIDRRKLQLIALHDKFDEHVPSEIVVRGTLYPGAVLESHGRRFETRTEKRMITLRFDPAQGRIVEKL
jgi:hypothetical protein